MQVGDSSSLLQIGLAGLQAGQTQATEAASRIASAGTDAPGAANSLASISEAAVGLITGETQVKASAAVVKAADEALGTLIDVMA